MESFGCDEIDKASIILSILFSINNHYIGDRSNADWFRALINDIELMVEKHGLSPIIGIISGLIDELRSINVESQNDEIKKLILVIDYFKEQYPIDKYPEKWF